MIGRHISVSTRRCIECHVNLILKPCEIKISFLELPVYRGRKQQIPEVVCYERIKVAKFLQKRDVIVLNKYASHVIQIQQNTVYSKYQPDHHR